MLEYGSILVVGTVRNVANTVNSEINRCLQALYAFETIKFHLVESDSTDKTIEELNKLKASVANFSYKSLGDLAREIPDRLERIRYCRNYYVNFIRALDQNDRPTYVLVVDLDGMNTALNSDSILSCFIRDDWDVVVSNQTFGYYDILALRHPTWQSNDWVEEYESEKKKIVYNKTNNWLQRTKYKLQLDRIKSRVLYSKMIRIKKNNQWIKIDSGFGGAAIYKSEVFNKFDYSKEFQTTETDHVSLHRKLIRDGGKIYINPQFINSHFNTYNLNRIFLIRQLRSLIWSNDHIYESKVYKVLKNLLTK